MCSFFLNFCSLYKCNLGYFGQRLHHAIYFGLLPLPIISMFEGLSFRKGSFPHL